MPKLQRHIQNGAVFADHLSNVRDLELLWAAIVTSLPTIVASPRGVGKAIQFDGSDDKIALGDISHLGTVKSVAIWVYLETTTEQIIDLDGGSTYIHASAGTITATGFTSPTIYVDGVVSSAITAAGWHFVVVTTGTAVSPTSVQFATDNTDFGNVRLNDCSLWTRALSATEIDQLYKGTLYDYMLNLVSAWELDDTALVQDIGWKGNGNDGTVNGNPTVAEGPAGGKSLDLDGSGDYVEMGSFTGHPDGAFTICGWVKPDALTGFDRLANNGWAADGGWLLSMDGGANDLDFFMQNDASVQKVTSLNTVAKIGEWQFVAGVYDGTNIQVFQDDTAPSTPVAVGAVTLLSTTPTIRLSQAATEVDGKMAKWKFFDAALTRAQLMDLYQRERRGLA